MKCGYRQDILTENLTKRDEAILICKNCQGIMKEASISQSGEQYCSCCFGYGWQTPNLSIRKMIDSLKCSCPLIERGCKWFGTLEGCENHLDTCGYVYETCKLGCGTVLIRKEFEKHVVRCDHCDIKIKSCELNRHHDVCPKMKVSCDLVGCGTKMTREEMNQHLKYDCSMVQETCKLGCGMKITRKYLRIHEKKNCPQRFVKCDHCDTEIQSYQLNIHLDKCPKMKVSCNLCGTKMTREEIELHLKHNCGMVQEMCRLGCGVELTRDELRIHEKENCTQRFVKCDHCDTEVKSYQLNIHLDKCPKMKVLCNLCGTKMTRLKMELHLTYDCGMVPETCKLGCGVELTRDKLRIHEKENCTQRQVKCDHCDEILKSCELNEHLDVCPKMEVLCNLCGTKMTREEIELHLKHNCGMVQEMCRLGCGVKLTRDELRIHKENNCPQRKVKCDHCNTKIKSYQLNIHLDKCPKMKVFCNLCGTKMTREDLELHLKYHCGMVQEKCKLRCGVELTRDGLRIHEKENCTQRQVKCDHCNKNLISYELNKHLKKCPKMKVLCELCSIEKYRKDMTQHLEDDCPENMLDCPFVKYKCLARMKRKDIDKHLEEKEIKHLGLKLNTMEDLINKQSKIINKQSEIINKQSVKIDKQSVEINKLNENIEKRVTTELSNTLQQIRLEYSITDTSKILWKIEDVNSFLSAFKQCKVAGYKFALKFQFIRLSIVFPGTTIQPKRPFIAKCHIVLHSWHTMDCGIIEVKQEDVLSGCERTIISISGEDIDKYSDPQFPGATKKDLTLEIFIRIG